MLALAKLFNKYQHKLATKGPFRENPIPWPETKKTMADSMSISQVPSMEKLSQFRRNRIPNEQEVNTSASTSTSATISSLDNIFATHGLPETIVSDNGTQFTSARFKEYCKNHSTVHFRLLLINTIE